MTRPREVCAGLLAAVDASEGRRKKRQRDTTADAIGLGIKRALLEAAVAEDPEPEMFEAWLLERSLDPPREASVGGTRAMALEILAEWRLAGTAPAFVDWLAQGAPSDDAGPAADRDRLPAHYRR